MNEDETFRILKRPSWTEMSSLFTLWLRSDKTDLVSGDTFEILKEEFFKSHGWTVDEFYDRPPFGR